MQCLGALLCKQGSQAGSRLDEALENVDDEGKMIEVL